MTDLSAADVARLLRYEPETGKLYWLPRPTEMFKSEGDARRWHSNFCGKEALTAVHQGYRAGGVLGQHVRAHRAAWAIVHGKWPDHQIDHINGVRDDNRLVNLREASHVENGHNMKLFATNTSGVNGVGWARRHKKWRADMKLNGKYILIGLFDTKEAAAAARAAANEKYGFTARHGQPAAA